MSGEATTILTQGGLLRSEPVVKHVAQAMQATDDAMDEAQIAVAMVRTEAVWEQLFPDEQQRIMQLLVEKIIVTPTTIEVQLQPNGIEQLALEITDSATQEAA